MGTEGMSYSLQSRDLIADSIETVMAAQWYDALIALPGCDKNMPGCLMAMARLNRPALMVYGGTIRAGVWEGRKLDIVSAFQCYGEYRGRQDRRGHAAADRPALLPRRRRVRRHVHGQHDGQRDRGPGDVAALQCLDPGRGSGQARRVPPGGPGDAAPARTGPQAAGDHDAAGVRERDGDGDGPGRLDERGPAPDGDGPAGGRAADARRLPGGQRPRAVPGRPEAQRQVRAGGSAPRSVARRR